MRHKEEPAIMATQSLISVYPIPRSPASPQSFLGTRNHSQSLYCPNNTLSLHLEILIEKLPQFESKETL